MIFQDFQYDTDGPLIIRTYSRRDKDEKAGPEAAEHGPNRDETIVYWR